MRDIKHTNGKRDKSSLPPLEFGPVEEIELFEASQASKDQYRNEEGGKTGAKRAVGKESMDLSGRAVPLAKVRTESSNREVPSVNKKQRKSAGQRPLFAKAPMRKKTKLKMGKGERKIVIVVVGLVIMAGLISSVIFLPRAKILLKLRTAPLLVDEEILIGQAGNNSGVISGTSFYREIAIANTQPVQTREVIGNKSSGVVEIINRTNNEQKIKELSRLETKSGILFYMQKHAIVPPNGSVRVEVLAAKEGSEGNIEPQKLDFTTFDDASRQVVWAEATEGFTGGSGESVAVVRQDDLSAARTEASNQARQQAEQQIAAELPAGWELLDESWSTEIIDFTSNNKEGDKVPVIDYNCRVTVRVMGYEKMVFEEEMKNKLEARLDKDYMLFPGAISFSAKVKDIDWDNAQATVDVRVTHSTIPNITLDTLRQKLAGRSGVEAREYLEGLSGVRSVNLELWPFWVKSIPRIEKRVNIELESEKKI